MVKFGESGSDYDQDWLCFSEQDVKSLEHSFAQRQRDLAVAVKANSRGFGDFKPRSGRSSDSRPRSSLREFSDRRRRVSEEDNAKMKSVECYSCNKQGHFAWGCPDKRRKRSRGDDESRA